MTDQSGHGLPAGRPPWDQWNGARVGAIVGGIVGLGIVFALSLSDFWLALIGAASGAAAGYWVEKRKQGPASAESAEQEDDHRSL